MELSTNRLVSEMNCQRTGLSAKRPVTKQKTAARKVDIRDKLNKQPMACSRVHATYNTYHMLSENVKCFTKLKHVGNERKENSAKI